MEIREARENLSELYISARHCLVPASDENATCHRKISAPALDRDLAKSIPCCPLCERGLRDYFAFTPSHSPSQLAAHYRQELRVARLYSMD